MEDLEKILKQLYLVSGLNMSIFDINQKSLASYPHNKSQFCHEIEKNKEYANKLLEVSDSIIVYDLEAGGNNEKK